MLDAESSYRWLTVKEQSYHLLALITVVKELQVIIAIAVAA